MCCNMETITRPCNACLTAEEWWNFQRCLAGVWLGRPKEKLLVLHAKYHPFFPLTMSIKALKETQH